MRSGEPHSAVAPVCAHRNRRSAPVGSGARSREPRSRAAPPPASAPARPPRAAQPGRTHARSDSARASARSPRQPPTPEGAADPCPHAQAEHLSFAQRDPYPASPRSPEGLSSAETRNYASCASADAQASPPAPPAAGYGDPSPAAPRLRPHAPRHRSPPPQRAPHTDIRRSRVMSPSPLNAYGVKFFTERENGRLAVEVSYREEVVDEPDLV